MAMHRRHRPDLRLRPVAAYFKRPLTAREQNLRARMEIFARDLLRFGAEVEIRVRNLRNRNGVMVTRKRARGMEGAAKFDRFASTKWLQQRGYQS